MKSCCLKHKKHNYFIATIFFAIALVGSVLLIVRISYAGISINTNVSAMTARQQLQTTQSDLGKTFERLSSGLRINNAADDAAGLMISEKFSSSIRGLQQAMRNTADGISMAKTVEGDLAGIDGALQRIKELAVQQQTADQTTTQDAFMSNIQQEAFSLVQQINSIAASGFGLTVQQGVSGKKLKICKKTKKAKKKNVKKISSANLNTWDLMKERVSQIVSGVNLDAADFFGLQSAQNTLSFDEFSSSADANIELVSNTAQTVIDAVNRINEEAQNVLDEAEEVLADVEELEAEEGVTDDDIEDIDITTVDTTRDAIDRVDTGLTPPRPITAGVETKYQQWDEGNGAATVSLVFKITDRTLLQTSIDGFSFYPEQQNPPMTGLSHQTFKVNGKDWSDSGAACLRYIPNSPLSCTFSEPLQLNKYNTIALFFQGLSAGNRPSLYLDLTSSGRAVGRINLPFRPDQ